MAQRFDHATSIGPGKVVVWSLLALSINLTGRAVLADEEANAKPSTSVTRRQIKTMQDSMGTSLTSTGGGLGTSLTSAGGGLGSKGKPAERSFSNAAYREKASAEMRRMHEQFIKEQNATNAPLPVITTP